MPDFSNVLSFEDATLHQPAYLDIQQYLQATSHPSAESFQRALQHLEAANYGRFTKLKEVAAERSTGSGESDLRRLKRHFASLKNTFIGYDLRQSFLEGLEEGRPDGTEEQQLIELEREVEHESAKEKQEKDCNETLQSETLGLIEDIVTTCNSFYASKAEISSHLECLVADRAQQKSTPTEALPILEDGPDENTCKALLSHEVGNRRSLETSLAVEEAEASELEVAIHSEEEQLHALRSQIEELEAENQEERTQDLTIRLSESARWIDSMMQLQGSMAGVEVSAPPTNVLLLRLTTWLADPVGEESSPSRVHELKLGIHPGSCQVHSADLKPADVVVSDIVDASRPGPLNLCSVVGQIQARLAVHLSPKEANKSARARILEEAAKQYSLTPSDSETYTVELAAGVKAVVKVPELWPEGGTGPSVVGLSAASGVPMSASVVQMAQPKNAPSSLLELLDHVSEQVSSSFSA